MGQLFLEVASEELKRQEFEYFQVSLRRGDGKIEFTPSDTLLVGRSASLKSRAIPYVENCVRI